MWQTIEKIIKAFYVQPPEIIPGLWYSPGGESIAQFPENKIPVDMLHMTCFYIKNPSENSYPAKISVEMKGVKATARITTTPKLHSLTLIRPEGLFYDRNPRAGDSADVTLEFIYEKEVKKITVHILVIEEEFE